MISLIDITENNYLKVCELKVAENQQGFVASPVRILASAYAMRNNNARAWAIADIEAKTIIGVIMVKDLSEDPACYTIEQFLIDHRHQNKGHGKQALKLAVDTLAKEQKYPAIEICVKKEASAAVTLYKNAGFTDTGYTDPENPDSHILRYEFS